MLHSSSDSYPFLTKKDFSDKGYPQGYEDCLPSLSDQITSFLNTHQLTATHLTSTDSASHVGNPGDIWNKNEQCFEFLLKLESKDPSNLSPLSGRTLRIKLKDKAHELPDRLALETRFEQLRKTAEFFLLEECELQADDEAVKEMRRLLEAMPSFKMPPDDAEPNLNRKDHRAFAKKILQNKYKAVSNLIGQMRDKGLISHDQFQDWKKHGTEIESAMILADVEQGNKRDVLVSVFPGREPHDWVSEWCEPLSDVPSAARKGEKDQLPNFWRVRTALFSKGERGSEKIVETLQYRSGSFPAIKVKKKQERLAKTHDITEDYLRTVYRDILLEHFKKQQESHGKIDLNSGTFPSFDLCVTSLLSPSLGGSKLGISLEPDKDTRQVLETESVYDFFVENGFKLDNSDVAYIAHGLKKQPQELQALGSFQKKPTILYQNYGSNTGRGLDTSGVEKRLRKNARAQFAQKIVKKHSELFNKVQSANELHSSLEKIKTLLKKIEEKEIKDFSKKALWREGFLNNIKALEPHLGDNRYKDLYNDLCLYYRYLNYSHNPYPGRFVIKNPKHNFMPSVITDALARSLGFVSHINCKSGEDRTGVLRILCILFLERFSGKNYGDLLDDKKYYNVLRVLWGRFKSRALLSNSLIINGLNAPGAAALQVESKNVPAERRFIVRQGYIAKLHKRVFEKPSVFSAKHRAIGSIRFEAEETDLKTLKDVFEEFSLRQISKNKFEVFLERPDDDYIKECAQRFKLVKQNKSGKTTAMHSILFQNHPFSAVRAFIYLKKYNFVPVIQDKKTFEKISINTELATKYGRAARVRSDNQGLAESLIEELSVLEQASQKSEKPTKPLLFSQSSNFEASLFLQPYGKKSLFSISTLVARVFPGEDTCQSFVSAFERKIEKYEDVANQRAKKIVPKNVLYEGVTLEESKLDTKVSQKSQEVMIKRDDQSTVKVSYHQQAVVSESMVSDASKVQDRDLVLQFEPIRQALKHQKDKKFLIGPGDPKQALKFFMMGVLCGFSPELDGSLKSIIKADPALKGVLDKFEGLNPQKNRKDILEIAKDFFSKDKRSAINLSR